MSLSAANGANYLQLATSSAWAMPGIAFTVSAWIYVTSLPGTNIFGPILGSFDGTDSDGWDFVVLSSNMGAPATNNGIAFDWHTNTVYYGAGSTTAAKGDIATSLVPTNRWCHVAARVELDSFHNYDLWMDGQRAGATAVTGATMDPIPGFTRKLRIRQSSDDAGQTYGGHIAYVKMFAGTLTPAEISRVMRSGVTPPDLWRRTILDVPLTGSQVSPAWDMGAKRLGPLSATGTVSAAFDPPVLGAGYPLLNRKVFIFGSGSGSGTATLTNQVIFNSTGSVNGRTVYFSSNGITPNTWSGTSGRLLVATMQMDGAISGNFTDSASAVWTRAAAGVNNTGLYIYYKISTGGETSVSFGTGASDPAMCTILEFSGTATSSVLDLANGATGNSATPTTPTITTANANDLLIVTFGGDSNGMQPFSALTAGYTSLSSQATTGSAVNDYQLTGYRQVLSTGNQAAQASLFSGSYPWGAIIAAFKVAPSGGYNPASSRFADRYGPPDAGGLNLFSSLWSY